MSLSESDSDNYNDDNIDDTSAEDDRKTEDWS